MIFQTRAGDYRKMGTEQCADGVTFTFQCPKELACAVAVSYTHLDVYKRQVQTVC